MKQNRYLNEKQIIFMFSGQGSQYYHMGRELYENHSRFKYWMDYCDKIVHPLIETSLIVALYQGKSRNEPFDHILYSNPALLCIEYSLARILMEMGIQPDFLLGYSFGEITASVVSGAISLEDGMQLVVGMARLVEEKTQPAEMLAIVESQNVMTEFSNIIGNYWITAKNFQRSFVVCGLPGDARHLQEALNQRNKIYQKLPVKYGFHTELIDPIEKGYKRLFQEFNLLSMDIPIISSLKAGRVEDVNEDYFWEIIRYPIDFEKTVQRIVKAGDFIFIDVGPSGILATFVNYLLPSDSNSFSLQTINQFGNDLKSIKKMKANLEVNSIT